MISNEMLSRILMTDRRIRFEETASLHRASRTRDRRPDATRSSSASLLGRSAE